LKRVCLILVLPMRTSEVHERKAQPGLEEKSVSDPVRTMK
jgi:hypothetical protein